jgi:hypothetical protein
MATPGALQPGTYSPADVGSPWVNNSLGEAQNVAPIQEFYTPADASTPDNAQRLHDAPAVLDYHAQGMLDTGQVHTQTQTQLVGSWEAPLVSERARGQDLRHARGPRSNTRRPWETDYGPDAQWLAMNGSHVIQIPGAAESKGVLVGNILTLPQPPTARVPPPPWDEPYRILPTTDLSPDVGSTGL